MISDDLLVVLETGAPLVDAQVELWLSTLQPSVNVVATFDQG